MMLSLTNVSVNYGRLKADTRTHFFDAKSAPIFTWGVISNRKNAFQSACRIKLSCDGFFWDSGIVKTKEQKLVYFGGPIPQGKPVSLSLTIFDDIGNESKEILFTMLRPIGRANGFAQTTIHTRGRYICGVNLRSTNPSKAPFIMPSQRAIKSFS